MTDLNEPTRIQGRYLLIERIAWGGSAEVWRAHDERLARSVAVKLLHPHLVPDETSRRRLEAEGRLAASLSHPGIVQVYDVEADGEKPYLVMELIEGESLDLRLARDGALPARNAASIAADVAEALAHAHAQGVVHRDVKPSNILIDGEGRAHLADFGIAHSLAPAAARLTVSGTVVGTLRYISPEQLAGREVGPRSDLFGLGAVLFEMLTGHGAFEASSPLAVAEAQAAGPPEMPGIDPALAAITRHCLSQSVDRRPEHAGQTAAALRDWLAASFEPVVAAASMEPLDRDAVTRPIPIVEPMGTPASEEEVLNRWVRRARPFALGAVGLFIALLLFLVVLEGRGADAKTPTGVPTQTPVPQWMQQLAADYAGACGEPLTVASVAGLSQAAAEDRVASLIDACDANASSKPGKGNGKGPRH